VQSNDAYLSLAILLTSLWSSREDQTGECLLRSLAIDAADLQVSWGWLHASYVQIAALNTELTAAQADTSTLRWR